MRYRANRVGLADHFSDLSVQRNIAVDLAVFDRLDRVIQDLEAFLTRRNKVHDLDNFHRLRSIPGVGKILVMTILYEIHDIDRHRYGNQFRMRSWDFCRVTSTLSYKPFLAYFRHVESM